MQDKALHMALLFDFFGELLTEKQREYFDLYYNEDLSLSEIAENEGISRQGVRDLIVRAENILSDTEEKTGIVKKHLASQALVSEILACVNGLFELNETLQNSRLKYLAQSIQERAMQLKD